MEPVIRPATGEDLEKFIGKTRLGPSSLVYAIEYNGEVAAIFGRTLRPDFSVACSNIKEDVKAPKMTVFRTALKAMKLLAEAKIPLYAVCNERIQHSGKFLERLGFYQIGDTNVYKYEVLA